MDDKTTGHGIVVGIDGSDHSIGAMKVAAEEAHLRGSPLTLLSAYPMSADAISAARFGHAVVDDQSIRTGHEALLDAALAELRGFPGEVRSVAKRGHPTHVLINLSAEAEMIVVGSRGRGGIARSMLGSTSAGLPHHSKSPVVIVPSSYTQRTVETDGNPGSKAPVAVGLDGSRHSLVAALEAARLADERGVTLQLINAVPPLAPDLSWTRSAKHQDTTAKELQERLTTDAEWLSSHYPQVHFQQEVIGGAAAEVLIEASRTSQLTVVGSRGRGGFLGLLIGSTSNSVMHHAQGPLVIVPSRDDPKVDGHPKPPAR